MDRMGEDTINKSLKEPVKIRSRATKPVPAGRPYDYPYNNVPLRNQTWTTGASISALIYLCNTVLAAISWYRACLLPL